MPKDTKCTRAALRGRPRRRRGHLEQRLVPERPFAADHGAGGDKAMTFSVPERPFAADHGSAKRPARVQCTRRPFAADHGFSTRKAAAIRVYQSGPSRQTTATSGGDDAAGSVPERPFAADHGRRATGAPRPPVYQSGPSRQTTAKPEACSYWGQVYQSGPSRQTTAPRCMVVARSAVYHGPSRQTTARRGVLQPATSVPERPFAADHGFKGGSSTRSQCTRAALRGRPRPG